MNKLIELSIRGSLYFYLSTITDKQLFQLRQFASQFYKSNPVYEHMSDNEIMRCFTSTVNQTFDIKLKNIPVAAALVIK